MCIASVPIWMSEVVPARNRGLLVDIHGAAFLFGYMSANWVGYAFYFCNSAKAWRGPLGKSKKMMLIATWPSNVVDSLRLVPHYFARGTG